MVKTSGPAARTARMSVARLTLKADDEHADGRLSPGWSARIGWRWLLWQCSSHKNRTQRSSELATP
jgi:hypothetical protein